MKKIVFSALAACLLIGGFAGCNKKLDVKPVDYIDAGNALNTSGDVQAALVGCYTGLQNNNAYNGYIQFMSDLLADNGDVNFVGTYQQPQQAQRKVLLKDNITVERIWLTAYGNINRTNNVLANLGKLSTPAQQTSAEGEAKFIRSLVYFDLVRLYARDWNDGTPTANPGVPLVLTPTTDITQANQVPRNTVAEVYAQIITDLTTAEAKLLPAKKPVNKNIFATREAAAALLSRVYLQQSRFADAAAAANRVIAAGNSTDGFHLNANYADNFTSSGANLVANTYEDIFAVQINAQTLLNNNSIGQFYAQKRRADIEVQNQFYSTFEKGDDRANLFTLITPAATPPTYYSNKYDPLYPNIKIIRLDEMYLTRAEGNFRAGTAVGATPVDDINVIRGRAQLPLVATVTLPAILKERRLELAFEGFRLGDLKRNKESTTDPTGTAIPWNSPRLIFPIPLREINANPNLVQNAGY